jgi:hypothetical protein
MREGTTSRVMAAYRPYGEFYGFYKVSTAYFGYHNRNFNIFFPPIFITLLLLFLMFAPHFPYAVLISPIR